jgi:hypothetical protein
MQIETKTVRTFETGDVVGGPSRIPTEGRCYYWRDAKGAWIPFPEDRRNPRLLRLDDQEINKYLEDGLLVVYPESIR